MRLSLSLTQDGGGSLDLKELKTALLKVQSSAQAWKDQPDPNRDKILDLRTRADLAEEAARATEVADRVEEELAELADSIHTRADVQLGALLYKRKIKPGAVVTSWAKSRGEHAGELSRAEFREAVIALGLKNMEGSAIDEVFNQFDEDGGGYMDAGEAAVMIKKLQSTSETAEHDKWLKEREAAAKRSVATKLAGTATALPHQLQERGQSPDRSGRASKDRRDSTEAPNTPGGATSVSPAKKKKSPKSKNDAAAGGRGSRPALAVESVMKTVAELFSSDRERGAARSNRSARKKEEAIVAKRVARRIQNLQLTRAWNEWAGKAQELKTSRGVLARAIKMLGRPMETAALNTWSQYAADRKAALGVLRKAMHQMSKGQEIVAFRILAEHAAESGRMKSLMLRAQTTRVRMMLNSWRLQYGKPPLSICKALANCLGGNK